MSFETVWGFDPDKVIQAVGIGIARVALKLSASGNQCNYQGFERRLGVDRT